MIPTQAAPAALDALSTSTPLYGLDIETDTTVNGFDPEVAAIIAVAVADANSTTVLRGDEIHLLRALDAHLEHLVPGIIVTWNGRSFDLPFLARRATYHGVEIGLRASCDTTSWFAHRHLDGFLLYRGDVGRALPVSCGLKAMARLVGLDALEVDVEHLHELHPDLVDRYVASDAELARRLVMRRWPTAAPATDPPMTDPMSVG